ncbi:hypothetical protein [Flavobacterium sp.]|uniref:hypothetical protein n=1 Tax=Flavobacterium sp. TaxID=239 RepID=UPI003D6A0797
MKFFYLFLLLFGSTIHGQIKPNELTKLPFEELKKRFFDNENDKSKQKIYANAFLNKAKTEVDNKQIIRGYYYHSLIYKGDKAIMYLDSVIKYSINTGDPSFPNSAYCEKAAILERQSKFKEALNNYLLAEEYAIKHNRVDDYYRARFFIAISKSENLGEITEALQIYKEIFNHYRKTDIRDPKYSAIYQNTIFGIADSYKALKKTDSSSYYNKLGYNEAQITKNEQMLYMFTLNEGANQVVNENYQQALDSVNKALPMIKKYNDIPNIMALYYYLGKINEGVGNENLALKNYKKVDSMYIKNKIIYPELVGGYHFLISYYKSKGDKEKQLEYLTKYISIDSSFQQSHNKMYKLLVKQYDIPHLFKEKEILIKSLKKDQSYYIIGILLLIVLVVGLFYYQYRMKKIYKERFDKIVSNNKKIIDNSINQEIESSEVKFQLNEKAIKVKETTISDDVEARILKNLLLFENKKEYLKTGITLQSLSKNCKTNTVYLSKVINTHKNKKFSDYINDLRIDECVLQLQQNNQLIKYTIEAISIEFGFNNEDTFSLAFQKRMKLKPSFFIQELKKME